MQTSADQHTAGPWRAYAPQPARWPEWTIKAADGRYVASVQLRAHNPAHNDARLIAAAPNMREALELVRDEFALGQRWTAERIQRVGEVVRAAIALTRSFPERSRSPEVLSGNGPEKVEA